jgi:hypothetical protein
MSEDTQNFISRGVGEAVNRETSLGILGRVAVKLLEYLEQGKNWFRPSSGGSPLPVRHQMLAATATSDRKTSLPQEFNQFQSTRGGYWASKGAQICHVQPCSDTHLAEFCESDIRSLALMSYSQCVSTFPPFCTCAL